MKPLVFVAMPFGKKPAASRKYDIDFDDVYERGIRPAVEQFDVECIRADEERSGGVIHLPMYERLLLAEIAIVDVTLSNPNVFYELGVRHAARPRSTIILASGEAVLPFDIAMIRAIPYKLNQGKLDDDSAKELIQGLASRIKFTLDETQSQSDSPLFQMIPDLPELALPHEVTDAFRNRAREADEVRRRIDAARRAVPQAEGSAQLVAIEKGLGRIEPSNVELFLEVFLAYRDLEDFDAMIAFAERAPDWLRSSTQMISEQQAFALNRRYATSKNPADRQQAEQILTGIIATKGPSPETCGILGRVYKDEYEEALAAGQSFAANGYLNKAIDTYRAGFTADPRDYYPGVNLLTMLQSKGTPEALDEWKRTLPLVSFALSRQGGLDSNDYWQVATVLEISLSLKDADTATRALEKMETFDAKSWQFDSTRKNLTLLLKLPDDMVDKALLAELVKELDRKIASLEAAEAPQPVEAARVAT